MSRIAMSCCVEYALDPAKMDVASWKRSHRNLKTIPNDRKLCFLNSKRWDLHAFSNCKKTKKSVIPKNEKSTMVT
jgi:hypothetical protein